MIVPMKKIMLFMLDGQRSVDIKKLRKLGLLHLERLEGRGEDFNDLVAKKDLIVKALHVLGKDEKSDTKRKIKPDINKAIGLSRRIVNRSDLKKEMESGLERLSVKMKEFDDWGDFDPADIEQIRNAGVPLTLRTISRNELKKGTDLDGSFVVKETKNRIFAVCARNENAPGTEIALPEHSLDFYRSEYERCRRETVRIDEELEKLEQETDLLQVTLRSLSGAISFETVRSGIKSDDRVLFLTGYGPVRSVQIIRDAAAENGWGIAVTDPSEDDQVPTLTEYRGGIRMIRPVFLIMGTVPGYFENDISFFFLVFFSLFFAMIIGDAGYGSMFLVLNLSGIFTFVRKKRPVPDGLFLLLLTSISTIVWGTLSGTWFGYRAAVENSLLRRFVLQPIYSFSEDSGPVVQRICFTIGIVHIGIAHTWNVIRRIRGRNKLQSLSQLGWLGMVFGLYFVVLNIVISAEKFPVPSFALPLILSGLALVILFSNQKGDFFRGILDGLKNLFTTFLNSISAFADIISYLRLFAVGLATVEIAKSFNAMAAGFGKSVVGIIAAVFVLLLGHGLNIIMGALSIIVHGIRLNMLEFSGHLGMEWTGFEYKPFKEIEESKE